LLRMAVGGKTGGQRKEKARRGEKQVVVPVKLKTPVSEAGPNRSGGGEA